MKESGIKKLNNLTEREIDEYIDEFLSYLKFVKRRADSTIYEYSKILKNYKKFVLKYGLNKTCFFKYLEHISNLSQRTIKLRIVVLRSFLNYLYENGEITGHRYWKDANTRVPSETPKGLTEEQLEILFSVIDDEFDRAFLIFYQLQELEFQKLYLLRLSILFLTKTTLN